MYNYLRKRVVRFLVKNLFRVITEYDLLRQTNDGSFFYRGGKLSHEESLRLIKDAKALKGSMVYEILLNEMDFVAMKKINFESRTDKDVTDNQMLLYYNNILRKKVINIISSKVK